jgi:hypothetical protein
MCESDGAQGCARGRDVRIRRSAGMRARSAPPLAAWRSVDVVTTLGCYFAGILAAQSIATVAAPPLPSAGQIQRLRAPSGVTS